MRKGKGLKAVVMAALFGGLCITSPLQAADTHWTPGPGEKAEGPAPDLTQACTGATPALATPLCGLKTYLACVLYDAADVCAAAGLNVPERYPGPDTLDTEVLTAPWTLPFERLMPEGFALHIYDGGLIPPSRFQNARMTAKDGKTKQAVEIINTHAPIYELLMDIPEPYVKGLVYSMSFFFRQDEQGWRIVGWSSSRVKACDTNFGTAAWAPCRWFLKNLKLRDVFAPGVTQLWASPKLPDRDDYPHPGIEIMSGMPNQPVVAPFAGTIIRRSLKYPDMPLYDWVVIQGENRQANMMVKYAMVDRTGPMVGTKVDAAAPLGEPQWVEAEHPGAGRFVHMELLRDGQQIDPRSVMRERRQETGN
jgi:hypothetical protein